MTSTEFLQGLPKIQLHCHLEGTLRPDTFLDLARRHGVALRYRPGEEAAIPEDWSAVDPATLYRFADFREFLLTFAAVSRSLGEPADYARLAAEYVADARAQNVVYGELFISPSVWRFFHPELDLRACIAAIAAEFDAARRDGLELALIVDLTRNFGPESAMATARLAEQCVDLGVLGIGLGGDEARFPPELFAEPFAYARAAGLHTVAHAGEAAGAQSVRGAVETLGAERIGHGIRALEDADVVRLLAECAIPLEVCPTSNFLTGVSRRAERHALHALDEAGCIVTIDADDPALFGTSITGEYAFVLEQCDRATLLRFVRNAARASFAPEPLKAALTARVEQYATHVGA